MPARAVAAALLLCSLATAHAAKAANSYSPLQQTVHMGMTLTVRGAELSTADVVMLALPPGAGGVGCGDSSHEPVAASGLVGRNFAQVSSDGTAASITLTPTAVVASAHWCVKFHSSSSWSRAGTGTFDVVGPAVTSATTSFGTVANAYDVMTFTFTGTGLVRGEPRLAFKISTSACGGASAASELDGGDAAGLAHANAAGTRGSIQFRLHSATSITGTVRVCMSSNMGNYTDVPSLGGLSVVGRDVTAFGPSTDIKPSVLYTFTVTGSNFAASGSSVLSVKASSSACVGDSAATDVLRGDEVVASYVSETSSTVQFSLGPIDDSVSKIAVNSAGSGYTAGHLVASGGAGGGFLGAFGVGLLGEIDNGYITTPGKDFTSAPTVQPVYPGAVGCGGTNSTTCLMTQSVTQITQGGGRTRGCGIGIVVVGSGGGGTGFEAVIDDADDLGEILSLRITNHGVGYASAPKLIITPAGSCRCGTYIVDGSPTADSFTLVDVPGAMDPCFRAIVALGASFTADGGWNTRNIRLCARFGSNSVWSQISAATVRLLLPETAGFSPGIVDSGQEFTLQVTGTGFELDGPSQARIKIAYDCAAFEGSDDLGVLPGGWGRPCETITLSGTGQTCQLTFKIVIPGTVVSAQVCRRFGGGMYERAGNSLLQVNGFQLLSITPSITASNAPYIVTIVGINFDPTLLDPAFTGILKAKICPEFVCKGTMEDSNDGEPCAGTNDVRFCQSDAYCEADTMCNDDVDGSAGVFPGGGVATILRVQNCNSQNYGCTEAVFDWTLLSMANVHGRIYWMYDYLEYASFAMVPNSQFVIEGTWLTGFHQTPLSPVESGSPLTLNITGRNMVNAGLGGVKFKFISFPSCEASGYGDDEFTFVGGSGRRLKASGGTLAHLHGEVDFTLSFNFREAPLKPARACWRIGNYKYREVEVWDAATLDATTLGPLNGLAVAFYSHGINIEGTWVDGMAPTDFKYKDQDNRMITKIQLGKQELPIYESGASYQITVFGGKFGDSAETSPLVLRPIPMPFEMDDNAIACIDSSTTVETRSKRCKEFVYTLDAYDGGASSYCGGTTSEIDSVHVEDYYPTRIQKYLETADGITREMSYAVFNFTKVLLEHQARFIVCWRMSRTDHDLFPWATIGHIDYRTLNLGVMGIVAWDVWVTHTFGMKGAYVESVTPEPNIVANRPFMLSFVSVGAGCDPLNPKFRLKLALGNGVQALIGGAIGGGCPRGSGSASEGAVIGGGAVTPVCTESLSGRRSVAKVEFTVVVGAETRLELCWSSTAGMPKYTAVFYAGGSTTVVLSAKAPFVSHFLLNNQPIASSTSRLMAHQPFSLTLVGEGLMKTGALPVTIAVATKCGDDSTILPGGDWRPLDCIFGHQGATVEFNIYRPVTGAQICLRRTTSNLVWSRHLEGSRYFCTPSYCGAPRCHPGTNYLVDDAACDEECCRANCRDDPLCNYWQRYEIPGRVFRRCQTMAHCENPSILELFDRVPIIWQKTAGLNEVSYAATTLPAVSSPLVFDVTPQVNPVLRARIPFVVNVQGTGFATEHVQIHLKVADEKTGCNDMGALNRTLMMWEDIKAQREAIFTQLEISKSFNYNGTCAGGDGNCVGGPAPVGTVCFVDNDCIPAAGGACMPANTGTSCLLDSHCTYGGICNNSLYNLSITPPPVPPAMQIPFVEVSDAGTLRGGQGKFLTVHNFSYGTTTFQIDEGARGVLCYNIRNPEEEKTYIVNGQITDRKIIDYMSGYVATRSFEIFDPAVSTVTPDHTFLFVDTLYTIGGVGLSVNDRMKIVHPAQGCTREGLSAEEAHAYGAVKGGDGVTLDSVNAVGTQGVVRMQIREPLKLLIDENQLVICFQFDQGPGRYSEYKKVGDIYIANSPPIVTAYSPKEMYYTETTHIILQGMALGAAQKIKLIDALQHTCGGETMNDQIRDEFAVAPGSLSSFLTLVNDGDYYEVFQDPYTSHAYLMQAEGVLNVMSDSQEDSLYTVCLKYGDLSLGGGTPGYIAVGNITAKPPRVTGLASTHIFSGRRALFPLKGAGLLGQLDITCKLVHKFHTCSGTSRTAGIIAGGSSCALWPYPNRTSTEAFADVMVPAGVETEANVCVRIGGVPWGPVGVLQIKRPPLGNARLFHASSKTPLQDLATGEPFYVLIEVSAPLLNLDMIKVVRADAACGGTDALADAVQGGAGTNINATGIAVFGRGVDSGGAQIKLCTWMYGTAGYEEDSSSRWTVLPPSVATFTPTATSLNVTTLLKLTGRGLATASSHSVLYSTLGAGCSQAGITYQLTSSDGLLGRAAQVSAEFYQPGQYTMCLRRGSMLMEVATLTVHALPIVQVLKPTVAFRGNHTAFLLIGAGLSARLQVKFVRPGDVCDGNTSLIGGDWSQVSSGSLLATDATRFVTNTFVFPNVGSGSLCLAVGSQRELVIDSGISIAVREWIKPILFSPQVSYKTDIQRVEANMTDVVPACAANYKSKWMIRGPGNGIERETPYVVDWNSEFKCYESQAEVPQGYPGLYAPPGRDMRLVSTVRDSSIQFDFTGGVGVGDQVFISRGKCGDELTKPEEHPAAAYVAGGEPVVITQAMIRDVTGDMCRGVRAQAAVVGPSIGTDISLTGANRRSYGVSVSFTLTEISGIGQFHKLCIVPAGLATALSIEDLDIKVRPPALLAMEPPIVYSGMRMPYVLRGIGLSAGDQIKIMDGETYTACARQDDVSDLRGGRVATLGAQTSSTTSSVEFTFEIPSKHARVCYKYKGSSEWGEMTDALSLRTSGYIYGYHDAMHFWYGETAIRQSGDNAVFGRNQTILVMAPIPKFMTGDRFVARTRFSLTVEGEGLTEKARYIIVPIRVRCGGMPAGRRNLMEDSTVFSSVRLRTAIGGESRPPTSFSNNPADSFEKMSQCTGSNIRDGCFAALATSQNTIEYPVGISIKNLGRTRVCYLHDFASEYQEVGQLDILPPFVTHVYPRTATINIPFSLTIRGQSLRSTDRVKIVDGVSCHAPISSRPYSMPISVTDSPAMTTAVTQLTLAGKGAYASVRSSSRKICYSYDKGVTYQDAGFTMWVKSPQLHRIFPTTLAIAGERRIWVFGDAIAPGDRIKIIHRSRKCQGLDDWESVVYGGEGRALDVMAGHGQVLPDPIGETQWPAPWPNGSAVFVLMRSDEAVVCYLHRDGAGWQDVRGADGERIVITARDTSDLALGRTGPEWGNTGARVQAANLKKSAALALAACVLSMLLYTAR